MVSFWKRNERDERDQRKMAERQELENAKRAEAEREANRQKRKLNFLISQTELYSHFIGKKVRTEEAERSGDMDVAVSQEKIQPGDKNAHTIDLPASPKASFPPRLRILRSWTLTPRTRLRCGRRQWPMRRMLSEKPKIRHASSMAPMLDQAWMTKAR